MIEWLDATISVNSLIWLFLVAFMLHDFEEIIRIEPWFKKHYKEVYPLVPKEFKDLFGFASKTTASQIAIAVCTVFVMFAPFTFLAAEHISYLFFLGFNVVLFLHVFMHIGQSLYVKKLVPGVVTAVGITLPYSVYLFYRLLTEELIEMRDIFISLPFGLLLIPVVLLGHALAKKLTSLS